MSTHAPNGLDANAFLQKYGSDALRLAFDEHEVLPTGPRSRFSRVESQNRCWPHASQYVLRDPSEIEPRCFLYGRHLIRGMISLTVAPGGVGKSSLAVTDVIAMVTGRSLIGDRPTGPLRVLYINGEDPIDEIDRRFAATCAHYGVAAETLGDRLFVASGRDSDTTLMNMTRGYIDPGNDGIGALVRDLVAHRIDVLVLDPLAAFHTLSENDNAQMSTFMRALSGVAHRAQCAIQIIHHSRKGSTGFNREIGADEARGASAVINAVRSARILTPMSPSDAPRAGVESPRSYVRVDNAKANLAAPEASRWFRLVVEPLGNGRPGLPGDEVAVAVPWEWPDALEDVTSDTLQRVQEVIAVGEWRDNVQAQNWVGYAVARVLRLDATNPSHKERIKALLSAWRKSGALRVEHRKNIKGEHQPFTVVGEWAFDGAASTSR